MSNKEIDLLDGFTEEELGEILKDTDIEFKDDIDEVTKQRIMNNTFSKIEANNGRGRLKSLKRRNIIAASLALIVVFSVSPFGNKVFGMVKETLVLIPGIGAQKSTGGDESIKYVLPQPIGWKNGKESIFIKGITLTKSQLEVTFTGTSEKLFTPEYFAKTEREKISEDQSNLIYIKDKSGKVYKSKNYSMGDDGGDNNFHGKFTLEGSEESLKEFDLYTNNNLISHVALKKAEEVPFEDIPNKSINQGITIGASKVKADGNVILTLISPNFGDDVKEKRIGGFGYDEKLRERTNTLVDAEGKKVDIKYGNSYEALNDITFKNTGKFPYTLTIPNVGLDYEINQKVQVDVPSKEESINKDINLGKFKGKLIKATKYKKENKETLAVYLKVYGGNEVESPTYASVKDNLFKASSMHTQTDGIQVFEFEIDANTKNVDLTFDRVGATLKGPWVIKVDK
ncbi:hypothetical protein [Clostridium manihotivorum]|uniref:DUF4179 domain-containing protein n=1 Tax=Clostridium manihotivorum TaxID=2320868 RepID=A0A3R5UEL4_9CLOT|nr:hypothetical protein [Clostridium manihotivorum]QAA31596.1 hypothetical protein C1I91_08040 [Clostridium manihotivorum]